MNVVFIINKIVKTSCYLNGIETLISLQRKIPHSLKLLVIVNISIEKKYYIL